MRTRILIIALATASTSLAAQDTTPDSLPFRRGQWAVQFVGSLGASVGLLKFRSPSSAWVVDVGVSGQHEEDIADTSVAVHSQAFVSVLLGQRKYRSLATKVAAYRSLGLLMSYTHNLSSSPFSRSTSNGWQLGPFANVGGTYLVTSHLGIGATGQVRIAYGRSTFRSSITPKTRSWSLSGTTSIGLQGAIFF